MFDRMDEPPRGALILVYFSAAAVVGVSALELLLYLAEQHQHHLPPGIVHSTFLSLPIVLGFVILVRARAVAEWISNKFDE
jgi:cytosine/uracil/thiamine/allantoin permease